MAELEADPVRARLEKYVGRPMGPAAVAPDPVNVPMIRHWVGALDRNSVYLDEEIAAATRFGGIVAPGDMRKAGLSRPGLVPGAVGRRSARHDAREFLANRLHVGRDREAGQPVVVMAEHHAARSQQVGLPGGEAGPRSLDRFAVDVAASRSREDRDVRADPVQDPRPVTGRVLVEERAVGWVEEIEQRAAVAPVALLCKSASSSYARGPASLLADAIRS